MTENRPPTANSNDTTGSESSAPPSHRLLTIPNALCVFRIVGSPILIVLAGTGHPLLFVAWFMFLAMTDWADGKLAILLDQRSVFGARLDSWADAALYASLLIGGLWLKSETAREEIWLIAAAIISYLVTTAYGFWKFGRWPSYHTRAAKISWLLIAVGIVLLLADWAVWPFRIALIAVVLTNIEAALITRVLNAWQADVSSLSMALRIARRA